MKTQSNSSKKGSTKNTPTNGTAKQIMKGTPQQIENPKINPYERNLENDQGNGDRNDDCICPPEDSTNPQLPQEPEEPTTPTPEPEPEQPEAIRLNVVHLLFLHGLVKNFWQVLENEDVKMKNFLHDLILLLEIYIDSANVPEELAQQFNYSPLNYEENEL